MAQKLYNVSPESHASLNARAHPGGGTEAVELRSGEGLVEDQYEAQLKGLYVAYREPAAVRLAGLAIELEKSGFVELASSVDNALGNFYQIDLVKKADAGALSQTRQEIIQNTETAKKIVGGARLARKHPSRTKAIAAINNRLNSIVNQMHRPAPDFAGVALILDSLLDSRILYGQWGDTDELDLENDLEPHFETYKGALEKIRDLLEIGKYEAPLPTSAESSPASPQAPQISQATTDFISRGDKALEAYEVLKIRISDLEGHGPDVEQKVYALVTELFRNAMRSLNVVLPALKSGKLKADGNESYINKSISMAEQEIGKFSRGLDSIG